MATTFFIIDRDDTSYSVILKYALKTSKIKTSILGRQNC